MYSPNFNGCWARVAWAKAHRDTLNDYIAGMFAVEQNRPKFGLKLDRETEEHVLYVSYMPDLADFFRNVSLRLGDTIHNLRSALDHLVFQLALRNTSGTIEHERRVQFPIEDKPSAFETRCKPGRGGWLAEVHRDDRAVIERFQGYHRIQEEVSVGPYFHPLVMLRELSDMDKHRLLATVMVPSTGFDFIGDGVGGLPFLVFMTDFLARMTRFEGVQAEAVELGTELARVQLANSPPHPDADMAGYLASVIALREGRPIIQVIDKIAATVTTVLSEFGPVH
jgi:hypothetical protein